MKIAITGASGQLGRLAIENLKTRVDAGDIVALVRDPSKVADLGVEAREADYHKPETLTAALQRESGGDTLLPVNIPPNHHTPHQYVIIAMDAAGQLGFSRLRLTTSEIEADATQ